MVEVLGSLSWSRNTRVTTSRWFVVHYPKVTDSKVTILGHCLKVTLKYKDTHHRQIIAMDCVISSLILMNKFSYWEVANNFLTAFFSFFSLFLFSLASAFFSFSTCTFMSFIFFLENAAV